MSDAVIMLAELTIRPDRVADFLAYTTANLPVSRAAAGNLAFDILVDDAQPDVVRFYERWTSAEAQRAYMAWRTERGDLTELLSYLAAPPRFVALRAIAV